MYPKKYVPKNLTRKDKKKQKQMLNRSMKQYRKKKILY